MLVTLKEMLLLISPSIFIKPSLHWKFDDTVTFGFELEGQAALAFVKFNKLNDVKMKKINTSFFKIFVLNAYFES